MVGPEPLPLAGRGGQSAASGATAPPTHDSGVLLRHLFERDPDARLVLDAAGNILLANPRAEELLGPGLTGRRLPDLPESSSLQVESAELPLGEETLTAMTVRQAPAASEAIFHDALTGLANRSLLLDRLRHALARARRSGTMVAVLFLDLDDFKSVNDSRGHDIGDELLAAIAPRLRASVRPGDTVARFGGDEFVVLLEDLSDVEEAREVALRISAACEDPVEAHGLQHHTSLSAGIAVAEDPGSATASSLLRDADAAMYRAKARGKGRVEVFDQHMRARMVERAAIERSLRRALARQELSLLYQPVMSLSQGRVVGAEALLRWHHPRRGLLMPAMFMEVAQNSGLILGIGEWVLEQACRQGASWQRLTPAPPRVSVNLSGPELARSDLAELVARTLRLTGLPAELLELEITEGMLLADRERCAERLWELDALGVRLVIDDFGTGHSSLSDLGDLPIHGLKIDRSFVRGLDGTLPGSPVVAAVLSLAEALSLEVTAEGVENHGQLAALRERGCDTAQGFLLGPPSAPERLEALLLGSGREQRLAV